MILLVLEKKLLLKPQAIAITAQFSSQFTPHMRRDSFMFLGQVFYLT